MADGVVLNAMSGGSTCAADEIAGEKFQRIKLVHGVDSTNDGDVATINGLPVKEVLNTIDFGGSATATLFIDVSVVGTYSSEISVAGGTLFIVRSEFKTTSADTCEVRPWVKDANGTETWTAGAKFTVSGTDVEDGSGPGSAVTLEQTGTWYFGQTYRVDVRGWTTICFQVVTAPTTGVSMWGDLV